MIDQAVSKPIAFKAADHKQRARLVAGWSYGVGLLFVTVNLTWEAWDRLNRLL